MKKSIILVDDFYKDPYAVRNYALSLDYKGPEYKTGYPGIESKPLTNDELKPIINSFSQIIGKKTVSKAIFVLWIRS